MQSRISQWIGWAQPMPDIQKDIWGTLKGEQFEETEKGWCISPERVIIDHQQLTWTGYGWRKILPRCLQKEYGSTNTLGMMLYAKRCEKTKFYCFELLVRVNFNPVSRKQIYRHKVLTGFKTVPEWCLRWPTWGLIGRAVGLWLPCVICASLNPSHRNSRVTQKTSSWFPFLLPPFINIWLIYYNTKFSK